MVAHRFMDVNFEFSLTNRITADIKELWYIAAAHCTRAINHDSNIYYGAMLKI